MTTTETRSDLTGAHFKLAPGQVLLPGATIEVDLTFATPTGGENKNWTGIDNVLVSTTGVTGTDSDGRPGYVVEIGDLGTYQVAVLPDRRVRLLGRRSS